jgi:hypothetical protein
MNVLRASVTLADVCWIVEIFNMFFSCHLCTFLPAGLYRPARLDPFRLQKGLFSPSQSIFAKPFLKLPSHP